LELTDAVVVVTGGTGGLGSRISRKFARLGARVAIAYLSRTAVADELAAALLVEGAAASLAVQADVTQPEPIAALVDRVVRAWGRVDVLVNNAAFNQSVPFADLDGLSLELWDKILRANTTGPFLCAKAVAPVMRRQGHGHIVNIGSVAGFQPGGSSIAYAVSKAGLAHLTRCLAVALSPEVLVNSVAPGLMAGTTMTERLLPEQVRKSTQDAVLHRAVEKDDVADQVLAFVRSESITGQNVVIDAGRFFH
jgi:NAD(P)-dependent dehydrogenase (short-subunit alcohol dehydrogenase family)